MTAITRSLADVDAALASLMTPTSPQAAAYLTPPHGAPRAGSSRTGSPRTDPPHAPAVRTLAQLAALSHADVARVQHLLASVPASILEPASAMSPAEWDAWLAFERLRVAASRQDVLEVQHAALAATREVTPDAMRAEMELAPHVLHDAFDAALTAFASAERAGLAAVGAGDVVAGMDNATRQLVTSMTAESEAQVAYLQHTSLAYQVHLPALEQCLLDAKSLGALSAARVCALAAHPPTRVAHSCAHARERPHTRACRHQA
ncbi:hypothetical protein EON68_02060 [archaeon]|nr:MAG: hypothetical protein EON68_02060 [archaeon]